MPDFNVSDITLESIAVLFPCKTIAFFERGCIEKSSVVFGFKVL